ncbi:MAG: glutamate synthase large subunit [Pyrinomonadaceae bacterium]
MNETGRQKAIGLYDPSFEHDSCGVGMIAKIDGTPSHEIVRDGLTALVNMAHRGARGAEENTGDGAGILTQIPDEFLRDEAARWELTLPEPGKYAVGMLFLPQDEPLRLKCESILEETIIAEGLVLIGWRTVPVDAEDLGRSARESQPFIRQVFIAKGANTTDNEHFERKLYVVRRWAKELLTRRDPVLSEKFYFASLSSRTIIYKGMLTPEQLGPFYRDLRDESFGSAIAIVHSRFSTNTFPNWNRAQPLRYVAHNGEINTLRGNLNWMRAREGRMSSKLFGDDLQKVMHVIDDEASDSGAFDNALEMLTLSGRELPHCMMMMIPEPLHSGSRMSDAKRAFYDFHSCLIEPWDGPASMTFTDGTIVGAVLDRNGLRPSRYTVTKQGMVIMASEVGVLDIDPADVLEKGRLQPGKMFLVDTKAGRILTDVEVKARISEAEPYREWLDDNLFHIDDLPDPPMTYTPDTSTLARRQKVFGYSEEEIRMILTPMAETGAEPIGSMGNDTPLAVLSKRPQLVYNYFKQLFAQVTNPPIDAIREELVTSTDTVIGPEGNLLEADPSCARQLKLNSFILSNSELEKIRLLGDSEGDFGSTGFKSLTIPILFDRGNAEQGLEWALDELCYQASRAIDDGYDIFILSDRQTTEYRVPIPALLAVSAVHHHLIREGRRTQVGFVLESGEPREVHHFAALLGYGATAINPYLAFETIDDLALRDEITSSDPTEKYRKAINKGVVKVISKMGISTIQSYLGAQVFEVLGINQETVDRYFSGTPSRIGGIGLTEMAREAIDRHADAFGLSSTRSVDTGGVYQWRANGETHLFDPRTIHSLQRACRDGDFASFHDYSRGVNDRSRDGATIRGLLDFRKVQKPVPIEEVEPEEAILSRFKTGAISYGSISREAHEALAIAMNRIGGKSNTGEGGEDEARYKLHPNGDSAKSRIKQVASGRFGVTSHYLVNADELQIKVAQGAKPGEGGQLPGNKVYPWIAATRHSTPGVGLISPPPHHDIYSIEDLAQLIYDLKNANRFARISVKLVAEAGVGTVAAGVAKAKADVILISGYDGGTGASPLSSIKHAGIPWEIGLAEAHQTLVLNGLRSRVTLETDGQLKTGRDVVIAAMLGAEEFGFATAPLVTLGCVMMRVCHLNTCPVGVATQDPLLREKFSGKPEYTVNFMRFVAREVRELMAELGVRSMDDLIGRTDLLHQIASPNALDLSRILTFQLEGLGEKTLQDHGLMSTVDNKILLDLCSPALERRDRVTGDVVIRNVDRSFGTMLGSEISRRYGSAGLPEDTIVLAVTGSAGQSFGALIPSGLTLNLEGEANDYLGKGLSGGKITVRPFRASDYAPHENIIIGNTALYGATSGNAFISGIAGERFAVRNSGADVVVEGVGDHGCEYMTGGRVVILGATGKNFAAGMSGGTAYVLDEKSKLRFRTNQEMVDLEPVGDPELEYVRNMIAEHHRLTESPRAKELLDDWDLAKDRFVRVIPREFRRVVELREGYLSDGMSPDAASLAAFVAASAA